MQFYLGEGKEKLGEGKEKLGEGKEQLEEGKLKFEEGKFFPGALLVFLRCAPSFSHHRS